MEVIVASNEEVEQSAARVVQKLREGTLFVTTVESCTGGGLANALTDIPGASEVMKEAFVTYSNEAKIKLGVPARTIERHSVYSLPVAIAMARAGLHQAVRADIAVGITGSLTRPDPANAPSSVPGEVFIAVVHGKHMLAEALVLSDVHGRADAKQEIIRKALGMILSVLAWPND